LAHCRITEFRAIRADCEVDAFEMSAGTPALSAMPIYGLVNSLAYNLVATKHVKGLADLKNRRIGVIRIGSSSHATAAIGLDAKRDNITYVQSGTMTTSLVTELDKSGFIDSVYKEMARGK
jgi:hypothetical protein